jgi:hypothetical protein
MATYKNPYKGKRDTPPGVMPEDMAIRHKLVGVAYCGATDKSYRRTYRHNRAAKKFFQDVKAYRQMVHGVNENRLCQSLRDACHLILEPMARSAGGASNWSKAPSDNDDTTAAVQTPLKV